MVYTAFFLKTSIQQTNSLSTYFHKLGMIIAQVCHYLLNIYLLNDLIHKRIGQERLPVLKVCH